MNQFIKAAFTIIFILVLFSCKKKDETIEKPDTVPPVITLIGASSVNVNKGDVNYQDAGATASDDKDGDITSKIAVSNSVDINTLGTYTVTYNVSDAAGNKAVEVQRKVKVLIY